MATGKRGWRGMVAAVMVILLTACGGGSGDDACSVPAQRNWLRGYMLDWYYWTGLSPNPEPEAYGSVQQYFDALRFAGSASVPRDRWSYISDSASYTQFFTEGKTLGYGLFVNGVESRALYEAGQPFGALKVRFVEAQSPAAGVLLRGDTIVSLNGRSAAELVAANDFSALSPSSEGQVLNAVIDFGSGPTPVTLAAATYSLTPVTATEVIDLGNGQRAGYLVLKDFVTQAEAPLADAFTAFRTQGATELILDLRYNGGGRVSTSAMLASLVAGVANNNAAFTTLRYNSRHPSANFTYNFAATAPGFSRVVVLTGSRTCSASELVVNGLKPYVNVVTLGDTTCGKPFGFSPATYCSSTYSAVNFESVNALGLGQYYDGIAATCAAADDFSGVLGAPTEKLLAAATGYLQTGTCPVVTASERPRALSISRRLRALGTEPGERQGMWAD